ncbi:MAG: ABC transporter ATP-binding protein [Clostridiales bacterium]|jgi:putative ABC transport system ATP-binding protein|nr:ABC transporter ATP-binding protein [Clostridiales bacterium]
MAFIELSNVTKSYPSSDALINALDGISLEIEKGAFTVILGPSGSGKSTLLNLIGGMDLATSGEIIVGGDHIETLSQYKLTKYRREKIGFVFQFYNLIPNLTCFENVDIASKLSANPIDAKEVLEMMGLQHRLKNFPAQLSGGEQQRASMARALCKNPEIMLCDEPTGALDTQTGNNVLSHLQSMSKKYEKAVIVVTHNASIAPAADRLIELKDGKVEKVKDNELPEGISQIS